METNSTLVKTSRYVAGGTTEVSATTLEWWDRSILYVNQATDTAYTVPKKHVGRLDLIASEFLGEPRYWYLIAMLNNILDPWADVREGTVLILPGTDRVKALMTGGKLGGVPSTRETPLSLLPLV